MTPRTAKEPHEIMQKSVHCHYMGGWYNETGGAPTELHRRAKKEGKNQITKRNSSVLLK